jgi:predicted N-acetyltransferase YhbS
MTSTYRIRPATPADAEAISAVLLEAPLRAWASFLDAERIDAANRGREHPADLVAVDDEGVFAFVAWDEATGEIECLFTITGVTVGAPAGSC